MKYASLSSFSVFSPSGLISQSDADQSQIVTLSRSIIGLPIAILFPLTTIKPDNDNNRQ